MQFLWYAVAALILATLSADAQTGRQPNTLPGCQYNATPPTLSDKQLVPWQCDVNGKLITNGTASTIVVGTGATAISGGTDTRVLFQDGAVIGENAGLTFTKGTGTLGLASTLNFTGTTAQISVGGAVKLDYNVNNLNVWSFPDNIAFVSTAIGTGIYFGPRGNTSIPFIGTDSGANQLTMLVGSGSGQAQRFSISQLGSVGSCNSGNSECANFDWQGTANVFTISSTATGSGTARPIRLTIAATPIFTLGASTPTANTCAGFVLGAGSTDTAGKITYSSATTCTINFGKTFATAPACMVMPGSAASTVLVTTSTTVLSVTFGTAQTALAWHCFGT